ncbi:MAG TPA: hypothetical protein VNT02_02450 [Burkholderiales bacterium]|nr:hypothetical protein [Burkholderiales bacterium]
MIDIRGPNAFYERGGSGRAVQARDGQPVYEGDRIFTGAATRMTLRFTQGGHAELDELTDPVPRFLADLGCLVVDLLRTGRMFVDGSAICVGAVGTIARQDSQVVYDVRPGYAQITVAGGRAQLRRPQSVDIPAGWRLDASAREVMHSGRPYPLTRAQVEDAVRWTRWYERTRPSLPGTVEGGVIVPPFRTTRPPQAAPPTQPEPPAPPPQTTVPPSTNVSPPQSTIPPPTRTLPRYDRAPLQTKPKTEVIR